MLSVQKSIVIIDDSKILIRMLTDFFVEKMGYSVAGSGVNGVQAVNLYRQHRPDLLTLDLTMPVKDGRAALSEIIEEFPEARILIVSSITGSSATECLQMGASGYVEKPLRLDDDEFVGEFMKTVKGLFPSKERRAG